QGLRLHAYRDFASAQQLADEAAFELSADHPTRLAERERLQRATADAQSIFLTQLAIANQRPNVAPAALSDALVDGVRRFDAVVAESLSAIADRAERTADRVLPDLRGALAAVTDVVRTEGVTRIAPEYTAHLEARLALYRE